jgi:hypothetical protein
MLATGRPANAPSPALVVWHGNESQCGRIMASKIAADISALANRYYMPGRNCHFVATSVSRLSRHGV